MTSNSPAYPPVSWLDPRVVSLPSAIEGTGLFATSAISKGELLLRLGGRVVTDEEFAALELKSYSCLNIDHGSILLMRADDRADFLNHSCDANLWLIDEVSLVARRDIEAGEELTADYALFSTDGAWSMACNCGSALCRGRICGKDWRRPDLQQRYAGHFSPLLNHPPAVNET